MAEVTMYEGVVGLGSYEGEPPLVGDSVLWEVDKLSIDGLRTVTEFVVVERQQTVSRSYYGVPPQPMGLRTSVRWTVVLKRVGGDSGSEEK